MKNKKILNVFGIICTIIIVLELGYMLVSKIVNNYKYDYEDNINNIIYTNDGYVIVGNSNFFNSNTINKKLVSHTDHNTSTTINTYASMSRIAKYDNNDNLIFEKTYECDFNSVYYDIIENDLGYLVVGGYAKTEEQFDYNTLTGLIVQYDFNGNILKKQEYAVLSDTYFTKIIKSDDNYVLVGRSILENYEIGNSPLGGGIIIKINSDLEILETNNFGGNKSGIFYDVIETDKGYLVCGKDAANYGLLVLFKKDFNREESDTKAISTKVIFHKAYDYVLNGFTDMEIIDNKLYLVGNIYVDKEVVDEENTNIIYDPGYLITDLNGNRIKQVTIEADNNLDSFNRIMYNNENIYIIGNLVSNKFNSEDITGTYNQIGILATFNLNNELVTYKTYGTQNTTVLNNMLLNDNKLVIVGTSNNIEHLNDSDYSTLIIKEELDNE